MYLKDIIAQTGDLFEVFMALSGGLTELTQMGVEKAIGQNALQQELWALDDELRVLLSQGAKDYYDDLAK